MSCPDQLAGIKVSNLLNNQNIKQIEEKGCFTVLEHQCDFSVNSREAFVSYFMQNMNVKKRQVLCALNNNGVKLQAGSMQWLGGNVSVESGVKSVGGFFKNAVKGAVTGESLAKPLYKGTGFVMLEPTYRYLFIEDVGSWEGGLVLDDGLFLACDDEIKEKVIKRTNISSAILGGEGLFNLALEGNGYCVLESPVPREELIEITLNNDTLKIDGNMAIAWSASLDFSVEAVTKSLIGSGLSGEGFVNVYKGTGKVLMAPTMNGTIHDAATKGPEQNQAVSSQGVASSLLDSLFNL